MAGYNPGDLSRSLQAKATAELPFASLFSQTPAAVPATAITAKTPAKPSEAVVLPKKLPKQNKPEPQASQAVKETAIAKQKSVKEATDQPAKKSKSLGAGQEPKPEGKKENVKAKTEAPAVEEVAQETVKEPAKKSKKQKKQKEETGERSLEKPADSVGSAEAETAEDGGDQNEEGNEENDEIENEDSKEKREKLTPEQQKERDERTVFVGNVDLKAKIKAIKAYFSKFGKVESVRLRSIPVADLKLPRKVSCMLHKYHPSRETCNAYVVFVSKEAVDVAVSHNGEQFMERHLRIDRLVGNKVVDTSRTIFVGNVPFDAENEELHSHFSECGDIESIRIVRDKLTGLGKGFAYICFKTESSINNAFLIKSKRFKKRELRISLAVSPEAMRKKAPKKNSYQGRRTSYQERPRGGKSRYGGSQRPDNRKPFRGAVQKSHRK